MINFCPNFERTDMGHPGMSKYNVSSSVWCFDSKKMFQIDLQNVHVHLLLHYSYTTF